MLFHSPVFVFFFLPVVTLFVWGIGGRGRENLTVLVICTASLWFYAWWNVLYLPILMLSICLNYLIGKRLRSPEYPLSLSRGMIFLGVTLNLGVLAYFKYAGYFSVNINRFWEGNLPVYRLAIPLGISFFTFQQIAYLVDSWKEKKYGTAEIASHGFSHYVFFVSFFPQLIAGPIVSHRDIFYQFRRPRFLKWNSTNAAVGMNFFVVGMAKKLLLGDSMDVFVNRVFNIHTQISTISAFDIWIGVIAYSLKIYFDFSGYSDMAIGLGRMLGVRLPLNFASPYQASSISEFWRRWHMTLSRFLRDYLYIPLGGGRSGQLIRYRNLMATMLLGGLWHGAGNNFIVWGGLHGLYLMGHHFWRWAGFAMPNWAGVILTYLSVVVAWIFFRATSVLHGVNIFLGMINPSLEWNSVFLENNPGKVLLLFVGMLIVFAAPNSQSLSLRWYRNPFLSVGIALLAFLCVLKMYRIEQFIYYQF